MANEAKREKFEKFMQDTWNVEPSDAFKSAREGSFAEYYWASVQARWMCWQAASSARQDEIEELVKALDEVTNACRQNMPDGQKTYSGRVERAESLVARHRAKAQP